MKIKENWKQKNAKRNAIEVQIFKKKKRRWGGGWKEQIRESGILFCAKLSVWNNWFITSLPIQFKSLPSVSRWASFIFRCFINSCKAQKASQDVAKVLLRWTLWVLGTKSFTPDSLWVAWTMEHFPNYSHSFHHRGSSKQALWRRMPCFLIITRSCWTPAFICNTL